MLVCGSLIASHNAASLTHLRSSLVHDPSLAGLKQELSELPDVWQLLVDREPSLASVDAAPLFHSLSSWLAGDVNSSETLVLPEGTPKNTFYAVLTVLTHILEYATFLDRSQVDHPAGTEYDAHTRRLEDFQHGGIQGLCIGLLSAIVLASSKTKAELGKNAAVAVRLAICAGACVDLAELQSAEPTVCLSARWSRHEETSSTNECVVGTILKDYSEVSPATHSFVSTLRLHILTMNQAYISVRSDVCSATITTSKGSTPALIKSLEERGAVVKRINLSGRYHHSMHLPMFMKLLAICESLPLLQFPQTAHPLVPLRQSDSGELVAAGESPLHEIALRCILIETADWHTTMVKSLEDMVTNAKTSGSETKTLKKYVLGPMDCAPRPAFAPLPIQLIRPAAVPESSYAYPDDAIAVVGLSCHFPNAETPAKFWEMLKSKQTSTLLGPVDEFDCGLFRKSPREAEFLDPQQRLGLHLAYEALESGGFFQPSSSTTDNVGCYVGVSSCDYEANVNSHDPTAFSYTGTARAFVSGRISHFFGLTGPSMGIDTACSSSGVAIHTACRAIQSGECTMALAGGINLMTAEGRAHQNLEAASFLSPTGECRPFDAAANGYRRGEGGGFVLLKRLSAAVADNDKILGVVAASAVNNSKGNKSITLPASGSQSDLYEQVLDKAGMPPSQISYVEAHGTGTTKGDPIECESIRKVLGRSRRPNAQPLVFGSVKGNFGHSEAASGVSAFIKTILMLQRGQIPPQANFTVLNPAIPCVDEANMQVSTRMQTWDAPFRAALVNNYGASGTNAAMVVCQPPPQSSQQSIAAEPAKAQKYPVLVSANTPAGLRKYCDSLLNLVESQQQRCGDYIVPAVACQLARSQNHGLGYRRAFAASSVEELKAGLRGDGQGRAASAIMQMPLTKKPVVLAFAGQTGREVRLSEEAYKGCALLRRRIDSCDRAMQSLGLGGLLPRLFCSEPVDDLVYLHCMHFAVQYAVAMSWIDAGLQVSALVGHSLGQLTTLCVSGVLSLRDALKLVSGRARLIQTKWASETGCMLSVDADTATVEALIQSVPGEEKVEIACYNSAVHHILAGTEKAVAAFAETAKSKGVSFQRLEVTHGFHSHLVNSILPEYLELIEGLTLRRAKIPIEACSLSQQCWSKVTAQMIAHQTREPVYWSNAIARVEERLGSCVWLEAGSRAVGVTMARRALAAHPATKAESTSSFHSARLYGADSLDHLTQTTLELWKEGVQVQSWMFHGAQAHTYTPLEIPSYCFENSQLWLPLMDNIKSSELLNTISRPVQFVSLSDLTKKGGEEIAKFQINQENEEYYLFVQGRTVFGQTLAPSSVWMEAASRALDLLPDQAADRAPSVVHQLRLHAPFGLDHQRRLILVLRRSASSPASTWEFTVESQLLKDSNSEHNRDLHASGTIGRPTRQADTRQYQSLLRHLRDRCQTLRQDPDASVVNGAFISKMMAQVADYDKSYMGIRCIACKDYEAVGEVDIPAIAAEKCAATAFIPPLFDNLLIVGELHASSLEGLVRDNLYICKSIDSVITHDGLQGSLDGNGGPWTVHSSLERESAKDLVSDMIVFRPGQKAPVLSILGARFTQISTRSLRRALESVNGVMAEDNEFSTKLDRPRGNTGVDMGNPIAAPRAYSNPEMESDPRFRPAIPPRCPPPTSPSSAGINTPEDEENVKTLTNLLSDHLNCSQGIPSDTPLVMLGLDSLVMMQLKSDIKKAFGSQMNVSKIDENCTLSDLCDMLFPNEPTPQLLSSAPSVSVVKTAAKPVSSSRYEVAPPLRMTPISRTRSAFIQRAAQEFVALKQATSAVTRETQFAGFFTDVYPDQMRLVTTYILEAFTKLGCDLRNMQAGEILPSISYLPKYEKLVTRLYAILESAGIISAYNGQKLRFKTINNLLGADKSSADLYRDILAKHPNYRPDHELLAVTGPHLAECLSGQVDGLQLIFQEAETRALLEDVYRSSPMFGTGNALLGRFVAQLMQKQSLLSLDGADNLLRILEVGAGTGGTACLMMDLLLAHKVAFHYTFTDISAALVASTRKRFEARYGRACLERHMEFTVLDAERPPPAERVGRYHMVVSSNCIHATKDLRQSCGLIEQLLRPDGGVLCLLELTRPLPWLDCVFGLLDGWWRFDDGRNYALQDEGHWKSALLDAGFASVDWSDDGSRESQQFRLITAWR
ncbi:Bcpks18 [Apiospora sp. TS-2023a]